MKVTQGGNVVAGVFSNEFLGWCADRQLQPKQVAQRSIYLDPADLFFLGQTGDPRAFDVRLQALDANNYFVAVPAEPLMVIHERVDCDRQKRQDDRAILLRFD